MLEPSLSNWRIALPPPGLDAARREAGLALFASKARELSDVHMRTAMQLFTREEMPSLSLYLRTMCVEMLCRLNERDDARRIVLLDSASDGDTYLYCTFIKFRGCGSSFDDALEFVDSVVPRPLEPQHVVCALNALVCDASSFCRLVDVTRSRPGWLDHRVAVRSLAFSVFWKIAAPDERRKCAAHLLAAIDHDDAPDSPARWLAYAFDRGAMPRVDKSTEQLLLDQAEFALMLCAMATRGDKCALDDLLAQRVSFGRFETRGGELDLHGMVWAGDIVLLPLVYKWLHCRKDSSYSEQLRVIVGRGKHSRSSTRRGSLGDAVRKLLARCGMYRGKGDLVVFTKALNLTVTDLVDAIRFAMVKRQMDAKPIASP